MIKPTVYIVTNFGGGVRKSTTMAHLTFALQDRGLDPLIVALDTNNTLENLLPEGSDIFKWDLNNETEGYEGLQLVLMESAKLGRPIVLDLAALGGQTLGIQTLLRTKMLDMCEVVSVVPVLPTPKSIVEGVKALDSIKPDQWILVQYNAINSAKVYDSINAFERLLAQNPLAVIKPSELTDSESQKLQVENTILNQMHLVTASSPFTTFHLQIYTNYWNELSTQYNAVLEILNPQSDESKSKKITA